MSARMAGMRRRQFLGGGLGRRGGARRSAPRFWRDGAGRPGAGARVAYGAARAAPTRTACGSRRASPRARSPAPTSRSPAPRTPGTSSPTARRRSRAAAAAGSSSRTPSRSPRRRRILGDPLRPRRLDLAAYRILPAPTPTAPAAARRGAPGSRARSTTTASSGSATRPGVGRRVARPALGTFNHEAAAVDPVARARLPDRGPLRRRPLPLHPRRLPRPDERPARGGASTPRRRARLGARPRPGRVVDADPPAGRRACAGSPAARASGSTAAPCTSRPRATTASGPTTRRPAGSTTIYDRAPPAPDAPLSGVDNLTVSRAGEVFVCEDGGNMEICVDRARRHRRAVPAADRRGGGGLPDRGNELAGVVFDPSGSRMYFAAQRAFGFGVVYEVAGPFARRPARRRRPRTVGAPPPALRRRDRAHGVGSARPPAITVAALRGRGLPVRLELGGRAVGGRRPAHRRPRAGARRARLDAAAAHGDARARAGQGGRGACGCGCASAPDDAARLARAPRLHRRASRSSREREDGGATVLVGRVRIVRGAPAPLGLARVPAAASRPGSACA